MPVHIAGLNVSEVTTGGPFVHGHPGEAAIPAPRLRGAPPMPQVALLSRFTAKEGKAEELIAAFGPVFEQAGKEPGTLLYVLHRSKDDPGLFWVSELYADDDAFAAHRGSEAMAAATPVLAALIAEAEVIIGEPLSAKGAPADRSGY
jgi:(4S)-4-hydroxy-5-phosphonooxypentane-2,3-dione isomerase